MDNKTKACSVIFLILLGAGCDNDKNLSEDLWRCTQTSAITDEITGFNEYYMDFSASESTVTQTGKIKVVDSNNGRHSLLTYEALLNSVTTGKRFESTLKTLDYEIHEDNLGLFSQNVSRFFPSVGQKITGEVISETSLYKTYHYDSGSVIGCNKL